MSRRGAIVFGGSGGIGSAIVRQLTHDGYDIAVIYRSNGDRADALVTQIREAGANALSIRADLTDPDSTTEAVSAAINAVKNVNVGVYAAGPRITVNYASKLTTEEWRSAMRGDADACFNAFSALLPTLKKQKRAALVAVTTTQFNRSEKRGLLSAAPKAAIEMLTRAIAKEEAANGVRANTVRAGWVDSQGLGAELLAEMLSAKAYQAIVDEIPMSRFASAEEIANAVAFLLSDKASYITGQSITVDGGMAL